MKRKAFLIPMALAMGVAAFAGIATSSVEVAARDSDDLPLTAGAIKIVECEVAGGVETEQAKTDITYNDHGDEISEITFYNDPEEGWVNVYKEECAYDSSYRLTCDTSYFYSDEGVWVKSNEVVYEYDAKGNKTLFGYYTYNKSGAQVGYEKETYEYDVNNNMTKLTEYDWVDNAFSKLGVYDYTYNDKNQKTQGKYYCRTYGFTNVTAIETYEYNEAGLLSKMSKADYDGAATPSFFADTLYTYDASKRIINETYTAYYDEDRTDISSGYKYEYSYNQAGDEETKIRLSLDVGSGTYSNQSKTIYTENDSNNYSFDYRWKNNDWALDWAEGYWGHIGSNGKIDYVENKELNEQTGEVEVDGKTYYYYPSPKSAASFPGWAIAVIAVGGVALIGGGLFAAWKIETIKVAVDASRKLKFLDKVFGIFNKKAK